MRLGGVLLLLASAASAQDPFGLLQRFQPGISVPGAKCRVTEATTLLDKELTARPASIPALERAVAMLARLRRTAFAQVLVMRAFQVHGLSDEQHAHLRGLRGYLAYQQSGMLLNLPEGFPREEARRIRRQLLKGQRGTLANAVADLRAALRANPTDRRSRETLADILEALDPKANAGELKRLRAEAGALLLRERPAVPAPVDLTEEVLRLRADAEQMEQYPDGPKHDDALELRKRALILDYCTHTIPFTAKTALWEQVALLAPQNLVQENLTRTFVTKKGEVSSVPVQYYRPGAGTRFEALQALAKDGSDCAAAALLAVLRRARSDETLARNAAQLDAVRKQLPRLLATALFSNDEVEYHKYGRRLLVLLAGDLKLAEAAPVLRKALASDDDLYIPLGVASALGRIGLAGDADRLVRRAKDHNIDVYFRREAAYALSYLAPDRLTELENDALLEIAVAAARYRLEPNESDRGRILTGLDRMHEPDEAAYYCAELGIREGLPLMERFLSERGKHYAAESVSRSYAALLRKLRG